MGAPPPAIASVAITPPRDGEVHRAAAAARAAGREAHHLGEQHPHRLVHLGGEARAERVVARGRERREHLREVVVVRAVGAHDPVARAQAERRADGHGLLPDGRVHRPVDEAGGGQLQHRLLEPADQEQQLRHPAQRRGVLPGPIAPGDRERHLAGRGGDGAKLHGPAPTIRARYPCGSRPVK